MFGASGAGAVTSISDPLGDAVGGAADITQVTVSSDAAGNVTFAVAIPGRAALTPDDELFVILDVDKDSATGISGGADFAVVVTASSASLVRAFGSSFVPAPETTLRVADDRKTITVNRSDLGDTRGFRFAVASGLVTSDSAGDDVPDSGAAVYDLDLKPVLGTLAARFAPARPAAGRVFRLARTTLRLDDRTTVRAESINCVAKLSGKRLAGRCAWRIPKNARGKRLVVTLTARYEGASATFTPWVFRVG
jgi:hypothetical protein